MSVIIKGMEMPKNCFACQIRKSCGQAWYLNPDERPDDCPLDEQPERKTGEWIPQNLNKSNGFASTAVYYFPKCSICGYSAKHTNFCPNCGADMRGEEK